MAKLTLVASLLCHCHEAYFFDCLHTQKIYQVQVHAVLIHGGHEAGLNWMQCPPSVAIKERTGKYTSVIQGRLLSD